jgi:2-keto-4-pentenoate hydratase
MIAITVYEVAEVCEVLAQKTGKNEPYSHTRVIDLIHEYLPGVEMAGKRYFLTETEIDYIADQIQLKKRAKIY